jgi:hypothetical protein
MYARLITGKFTVEFDDYQGYILAGKYDYQNGKWNHEYIVTDLLPSGSMTLTVKDNADDVQRFIRQDGVPASIKEEAIPEK